MFDRLTDATSKGVDRLLTSLGQEHDDDILFYESLQPEDLKAMENHYGRERTVEYVLDMENKRNAKRVRKPH